MNTPFLIDGGYVYWNSDESEGAPALWRRALSPESPIEYLASTKNDHVPLYIDHGRLFFVDAARIASVPVDGAAQPTPHAPDTQPGRTSVVADGTCVYWTSERGIYRSRLIGTSAPELIADERSYRSGPVVTDGQRLYWTDRRHNRILSLGRAAGSQPEPPVLVAKAINAEGMRSAVVDFPPPAGTSWSARHLINNGCDRGPTTLPACEAQTTGESWASILPKADGLNNHRVSVRDRLVVGPLVPLSLGDITCADLGLDPPAQEPGRRKEPAQPEESSSCDRDRRYIVLGTTPPPLRVWGQGWESFLCVGDESRQCCGSPAFGQMVVATGVLEGSSRRGWGLRDVTMCELPAR